MARSRAICQKSGFARECMAGGWQLETRCTRKTQVPGTVLARGEANATRPSRSLKFIGLSMPADSVCLIANGLLTTHSANWELARASRLSPGCHVLLAAAACAWRPAGATRGRMRGVERSREAQLTIIGPHPGFLVTADSQGPSLARSGLESRVAQFSVNADFKWVTVASRVGKFWGLPGALNASVSGLREGDLGWLPLVRAGKAPRLKSVPLKAKTPISGLAFPGATDNPPQLRLCLCNY